jgi:lipopolysaccharide/colanic/teichoic acid biosynthesis glycosyltransferase
MWRTRSCKKSKTATAVLSENKKAIRPLWQQFTKRLADIIISFAGLVILSPLIVYVAIRVLFSSKGAVVYSQERVGYRGKIFKIKKFRSMYENAELQGPQLSENNDRRVTPWGRKMRRWKLDELPQLWNVLIGEMSIVGPRPERAYYINLIAQQTPFYTPLLELRPGITSLGMIRFGYAGNVQEMIERMKYDLIYLENYSLRMDLKIMMSTIRIIFKAKGR